VAKKYIFLFIAVCVFIFGVYALLFVAVIALIYVALEVKNWYEDRKEKIA